MGHGDPGYMLRHSSHDGRDADSRLVLLLPGFGPHFISTCRRTTTHLHHHHPRIPAQDPAVMSAALCALHECIKGDPRPYKNLIPSFTSILKQVGGAGRDAAGE